MAIEIYWNKVAEHLLLPHIKFFKKIKRDLELVSLPNFHHNHHDAESSVIWLVEQSAIKLLIITVRKFQWSDWSNGVQLNC